MSVIKRSTSFVLATALAQLSAAAQDNEDRVFLTASFPNAGVINYLETWEAHEDGVTHLRKVDIWRPLISELKYPTYTAYDFDNKYLYVCDCDEIVQYAITFSESDGVSASKKGTIVEDLTCGGLAIDKFNNLFYVD